MIRIKDHKQHPLFDPWAFLSPRRRRMLDESWPGLFREHLLGELPVAQLRPFLRDGFGAPSKELYTLMGALLLQQTMDLTDHQTLDQLAFNIQWHYALNITEESDSAKYISPKTLWHWRQILTEQHLEAVIFDRVGTKLAKVFEVSTHDQRIDSVHIKSNMRKLSRIGIFSQTIFKFLTNLKRHHQDLFAMLENQLVERYASAKALKAFSRIKPSASAKSLLQVSNDLYDLIEAFKDQAAVTSRHSYKLMQRVFREHCEVSTDGAKRRVVVKKPKEVPSDSLQNPSDPDAAYSGHKGQGYQVQIMESFIRNENDKPKEPHLNLITYVAVEKANAPDGNALMPAIKASAQRGLKPDMLLADTLYGSDQNAQDAKADGVDLVAPTKAGDNACPKSAITLRDFSFDENARITGCPAHQAPVNVHYKQKTQRFSARFERQDCQRCGHVDACPINPGKKHYYLWYSKKDYRLAVRRQFEDSEAFIDIYRWRAGVEATMSQYDRLTGVKHLRVRGGGAVRFCATLKAAGVNILRAAAVWAAQHKAKSSAKGRLRANRIPFPFFKEQIGRCWSNFQKMSLSHLVGTYAAHKAAA